MSDSEYDSEEDEDYVPDVVSDEEDEGVEDERSRKRKKNKKEKDQAQKRKRKGGIQLEGEESEDASVDDENDDPCEDLETQVVKQKELSKSRADDLWAAFKRDTAVVRPSSKSTSSANMSSNTKNINHKDLKNGQAITTQDSIIPVVVPKKVEITETYDFAGEEVKVVKQVDASSLKATKKIEEQQEANSNSSKPKPAVLMKRSSGGLGNVLGKIGKKQKLSTLEKSKLDWNHFKEEEGIEDDLKTSNKDGYLEKQAFLNRVDHKQFQIERDIRQGVRKRQ